MTHDQHQQAEPEFSIPIEVDEIPAGGRHYKFDADEDARVALALRFGLASLSSLSAHLRVTPLAGGPMMKVTGTVTAHLAQNCVVTFAPVPAEVATEVSAEFGPTEDLPDEMEFTLADVEPPDPIVDGKIDLGELTAQYLYLALDPYPRAEGAAVSESEVDDELAGEETDSPFAGLADLKRQLEEKGK